MSYQISVHVLSDVSFFVLKVFLFKLLYMFGVGLPVLNSFILLFSDQDYKRA